MLTTIAIAFCVFAGISHVTTIVTVALRLRRPNVDTAPNSAPPFVSILRPVCGLENNLDACFESSFHLASPDYEVIFCADDEEDEAVPLVRRLIAAHPEIDASMLIGHDHISDNPKLNNLAKGWRAAKSTWIVISDSNTLLPIDYIERLWSRWDDRTGLVSAAMIVTEPDGFAAEIECAYMNSYAARWMLVADSYRLAFAHGKTFMLMRSTLDSVGGLAALDREAADELAATRIAREKGLKVRLTPRPIAQPIGRRAFSTVWRRQLRWARLRRAGLPVLYATEIFSSAAVPFALVAWLAIAEELPWSIVPAYIVGWYAFELFLIRAARWPLSWRLPLAMVVRDAITPVVWIAGWFGGGTVWRGKKVAFPTRKRRDAPINQ